MQHNGFEYVDLGLSVNWATCNVGANDVHDRGLFFAFGATIGFTSNDVINRKIPFEGSYELHGIAKRYESELASEIHSLPSDADAASIYMGGDWRMPTKEDFEELASGVIISPLVLDGVHGLLLKSKVNDAELFFVKSGYIDRTKRYAYGDDVYRSSSSLHKKGIAHYFIMCDWSDNRDCVNHFFNHYMFPIRGIIKG